MIALTIRKYIHKRSSILNKPEKSQIFYFAALLTYLFRASISEYSASISSLGGVVAVLEAVATPSSDIDSPATGRVSSTASVSMAPLSPLVSSAYSITNNN